jgi:hypothetical protein
MVAIFVGKQPPESKNRRLWSEEQKEKYLHWPGIESWLSSSQLITILMELSLLFHVIWKYEMSLKGVGGKDTLKLEVNRNC